MPSSAADKIHSVDFEICALIAGALYTGIISLDTLLDALPLLQLRHWEAVLPFSGFFQPGNVELLHFEKRLRYSRGFNFIEWWEEKSLA